MTLLSARAHATPPGERGTGVDLDLELPPGGAAVLPDRDDVVAWFGGHRRPAAGDELRVAGRRLTHRSPAARVRAGLIVVGDPPLAPAVSVVDHLAAATSRDAALALLEEIPRLAGRGEDPAGVLSGGERRLLGWARAVLLAPRVLVLDRAATGLDADAVTWAGEQVRRWRTAGVVALVRVGRPEESVWAAGSP